MPAPRYAIELVELSEQPALIIRATVKPDEISAQLADCFGRLVSYIEQAGGAQSGMPFMRYFDMSEDELVIGAGVPLAEPLAGDGDIEAHCLPGGRALTTLHLGDYSKVGGAWDEVWERAKSLGVSERSGGWDVYTNDPTEVAPKEVETRIYLPLEAA